MLCRFALIDYTREYVTETMYDFLTVKIHIVSVFKFMLF